jgi:hypothetical protein
MCVGLVTSIQKCWMYSMINVFRDEGIRGDQIKVECAGKLHDYAVSAHHVKFVPPSFLEF